MWNALRAADRPLYAQTLMMESGASWAAVRGQLAVWRAAGLVTGGECQAEPIEMTRMGRRRPRPPRVTKSDGGKTIHVLYPDVDDPTYEVVIRVRGSQRQILRRPLRRPKGVL